MLAALLTIYPRNLTRRQLGAMVGLSSKGGTFAKYLSDIRTAGYIVESTPGNYRLSDSGERVARDLGGTGVAAEPEAIRDLWLGQITGRRRDMLKLLWKEHPSSISRTALAELLELEVSGGTFAKYLSDLRRLDLAVVDGDLVQLNGETFLMEAW
jgi:Mn-dependent DtxR family transcriptional regulator